MSTKPCPYCGDSMPDEVGRSTCGKKACNSKRARKLAKGEAQPVWYGSGECVVCGATYEKQVCNQTTCGSKQCYEARNRERNRQWCELHRNVKNRQPWLAGQPAYGEYLPGGGLELTLWPPPKWPLEHRNIQGVHGMVTTMLGVPHEHVPVFSLLPWPKGCGWGVYVRTDAWKAVAGQSIQGRLFEQHVEAKFSPLWRLKAPVVSKRGRQRVTVSSITPVCTKNSGENTTYTAPTTESIKNSLVRHLCPRLGVTIADEMVCANLLSRNTDAETVPVGGKFGALRGWAGDIELEVNAVARWLLECGAIIGLGGRTALGFGRVRVAEVEA